MVDRTSFCIAAFEITIDHPHTHVVKCTQLVRGEHLLLLWCFCGSLPLDLPVWVCVVVVVVAASKDLAQTSYFMATNR